VSSKTVRISFSHFACESMDGASGGARGAPAPPTAAAPVEFLVISFQF
jgi:hypothetical protein